MNQQICAKCLPQRANAKTGKRSTESQNEIAICEMWIAKCANTNSQNTETICRPIRQRNVFYSFGTVHHTHRPDCNFCNCAFNKYYSIFHCGQLTNAWALTHDGIHLVQCRLQPAFLSHQNHHWSMVVLFVTRKFLAAYSSLASSSSLVKQ